jgi:hypothetical protein
MAWEACEIIGTWYAAASEATGMLEPLQPGPI